MCVRRLVFLNWSFSGSSLLLSVIIFSTSLSNKATETVQEISIQRLLIHYGLFINIDIGLRIS